jgi:ribulose-bisphosphate carboxylase small chain
MRITQGTFSFLPDLTDEEIRLQVEYCLRNDWPVAVEHTDDPHPRNVYWNMWGLPRFDQTDAAALLQEIRRCRTAHPDDYVRVTGYDRRLGRQTTALSFLVQRPAVERGFELRRSESRDRQQRYALVPARAGETP